MVGRLGGQMSENRRHVHVSKSADILGPDMLPTNPTKTIRPEVPAVIIDHCETWSLEFQS